MRTLDDRKIILIFRSINRKFIFEIETSEAVVSQGENAETIVGFRYEDPVIWTMHREYGIGLFAFGILGYAFVVFDERIAGIKGALVKISELERA